MYKINNNDGDARTGIFTTKHSKIKAPFFMPVATKTQVKYLDDFDLNNIGTQCLISNSFVLSLRPGLEFFEKQGGIHGVSKFKGSFFTDSGGFQKIRESFFVSSNDKGVLFKSPFDGKKILLNPEKAMEIQNTINSDIAMVIDEMPLVSEDKVEVGKATYRTHTWAVECLKHHKNKKQMLFGIAQGGTFPDLREKSAKFIGNLDFDGFAFGGLAIGEPDEKMYKMVNLTAKHFPVEKPRYLMGVGNPVHIVNAVSHGVDCFDSTFPTQNARHGTLFTMNGKVRILQSENQNDFNPIDKECECLVCQNYSKAFIRHLLKTSEPNGLRLASYHNIYFMKDLMEKIRLNIKENTFEKFKKEFLKKWI